MSTPVHQEVRSFQTITSGLQRGASVRKKRTEPVEAPHGRIRDHHRGLLKVHLELVAALEQALADIDATVGRTLVAISFSATGAREA